MCIFHEIYCVFQNQATFVSSQADATRHIALICLILLCFLWAKINYFHTCMAVIWNGYNCLHVLEKYHIHVHKVWDEYSCLLINCGMLKNVKTPDKATRRNTRQDKTRQSNSQTRRCPWFWRQLHDARSSTDTLQTMHVCFVVSVAFYNDVCNYISSDQRT